MSEPKKQPKRLVDPACLDLAAHFIGERMGRNEDIEALAYCVQAAVEEWFAERAGEVEGGRPY